MDGVSNNAMALQQYELDSNAEWCCNQLLMLNNYHQTPTPTPTPTPSQQARRHRSQRRGQRKPKERAQVYKPRAPRVPMPPPPPPPPPSSSARGVLNPSKVRFLFAKQLQNSDVSATGRIVIPKREAEMHLPVLEAKEGFWLHLEDMDIPKVWTVRFRFWPNNSSRMYVIENTKGLIAAHGLEVEDTIMVFKDDDAGSYAIQTRKSPMRMMNAQYEATMMMMMNNYLMSANSVPMTGDDGQYYSPSPLYYGDNYNYSSSTNVVNNSVYEYEHPMDNFYGTGMDQLEPLYRQLHRTPSFESVHNFSNFI